MQEFPVDESGEEPIRKVESRIRIPIFSSSNNDDKLPLIESQISELRAEGDFTYITQPQAPSSHGKYDLILEQNFELHYSPNVYVCGYTS